MKTFKIVGVLFFIFCLFVMPVSAFEDDFDDGEIASDWDITGNGVITLPVGGMPSDTSEYYLNIRTNIVETTELTNSIGHVTINYMSFWIKCSGGGAGSSYVYYDSNNYISFSASSSPEIYFNAIKLMDTEINTWYKIEVLRSGSNFVVTVYDEDLSTLYQTTTPAGDVIETTEGKITVTRGNTYIVNTMIDDYKLLTVSPELTNDIEWGLDQYTEGDTASYSWTLQNSLWQDLIYKYQIQILKGGLEINTAKVSQTGTRFQDVDTAGTYEVKLQYSGLWPTNWQTIDSDSVNVIQEVDSYINVPPTAYTTESFEISYLYGRTPLGPFLKISKQIPSETGDYTYVNVDADYLKDQDIVAGTVYTPNLTIFESGTYLIGIYDINLLTESRSMLIASDTIRIFYQDAIARINITESKIDTSNVTTIGLGDTLFGNYQVDSLNYTTGPIRLEMYNYENDVISFSMPKQAQKGSYELPIKNLEYFVEVKDGHETVYKVDALFYTGNNQVRLARYDSDGTYNQTLAYTNVTIDYVNSAGYSLILSKYTVVQNEPFTISVKCPTTSRLVIFDDTGYAINNINLSGNTNIPYSLSSEGKYSIQLYDPSTNLQCIELITVNEGVRPEDDVVEEPTQSTVDMVITFLSMPAFWGMVIWVGVVGGAAQKVSGNSTGYIAFLFANILAVVGLFAPYTIYIVLITWIAAGIFFKLGRDATGGE